MGKQRIIHGGHIDALTADEFYRAIRRPEQKTRVRAPVNLKLDAAGAGAVDVYKIPTGMQFEIRRVVFTLSGNQPTDPNTNNILLNAAGKWAAYLRGGSLIEMAQPQYGAAVQVPGVQTWGDQQGPYLQNGEVFGVQVAGLVASGILNVYMEGILTRPSDRSDA